MNNKGGMVIYRSNDGLTKIDVKFEDETVWLSQQQMSELYQTSRTNVVEHIKHIYDEEELDENSTCRKFRQVQLEGKRQVEREIPFYNLDMIISLGYRIKSSIATQFRRWATEMAEINAIEHHAMHMSDYVEQLDRILASTGKSVLDNAGKISHNHALEKAEAEYKKFIQKNLSPVEKAYLETIKELNKDAKKNSRKGAN